jgi:hypothetical protein
MNHDKKICQTCKYVFISHSSSTGIRCGFKCIDSSFPIKRQERMDLYLEVASDFSCTLWMGKDKILITEEKI